MIKILLVVGLVLIAFGFGLSWFLKSSPQTIAKSMKRLVGVGVLGVAGWLTLTGRWMMAAPLAIFALGLLGRGGFSINTTPRSGQTSTVRSAALEMELDHDSGAIEGRVLAGQYEGSPLNTLSSEDLKSLWAEISSDPESRALLEAYLDRRSSGWREDFEADAATGQGGATRSGPMTKEEAYQILGLSPGSGEAEIREAHRRLMKRMHPDQGGSTFLASKINEAKDILIGSKF
ncbi:DnaJ domain-containing protein [Coralliovum pocilloporae]|uniref:DnaJ domain-containing protein n=1 Tax=Coralliovum pocilloporae TaxID=3066369 RepID=UPI003307820D